MMDQLCACGGNHIPREHPRETPQQPDSVEDAAREWLKHYWGMKVADVTSLTVILREREAAAWKAGVEAAAQLLERPVMVFAFDNESCREDVIRRVRALPIPEPTR